ncbi:hypothetical protein BJX99DRAFT_216854 [Aspergillus californicus]
MSTWVALNIEPDGAIEEEVDDTKEIQIEEAVKLYQNALKLHSQGPSFYPEAAGAYETLLKSEIFNYPESTSDYQRVASELQLGPTSNDVPVESAAVVLNDYAINDSISSTLQQTIFLSYKNHGQFKLDTLRALLQNTSNRSEDLPELSPIIAERSNIALTSFAEALERDDTDLNLWRQSARLSSALQSYRLTRFCFESVLADDDNRLEVWGDQLGLEETFAEERLRETLQSVQDRLSVSHAPVKRPKKALLNILKRQIDPYPYLPSLPSDLQNGNLSRNPLAFHASQYEIKIDNLTWAATGKAILGLLDAIEDAPALEPGTSVIISLPANSPELKSMSITAQRRLSKAYSDVAREDAKVIDDNQSTGVHSTTGAQGLEHLADHGDDQSSVDQRAEKQLMESLEVQSSQHQHGPEQQADLKAEEVEVKSPENTGRKRSSASAITEDQAERLRAKSRRTTRLRDSLAEASLQTDDIVFDQVKYYEDLLDPYFQVDEGVFGTVGPLLSKLGVADLGTLGELQKQVTSANERKESPVTPTDATYDSSYVLSHDLREILTHWDDVKLQVMQQSDSLSGLQDIQSMGRSGLAVFLEHSRKPTHKFKAKQDFTGEEELIDFITTINGGRIHLHDAAFIWAGCLLKPNYEHLHHSLVKDWSMTESSYVSSQWPSPLKDAVLRLLLLEDEYIFGRLEEQVTTLEHQILQSHPEVQSQYTAENFADLHMIQTIFELHLDLYAPMNTPNNAADKHTIILQQERLTRWISQKTITLRHIWASTFHSNMVAYVQREHIQLCLQDLKHFFETLEIPVLSLCNNTTMSELSPGAIDQEISKLNSMEFFLRIFNPDSDDPVELIETIEPIVEPSSVQFPEECSDGQRSTQHREMASFLDRGDATLRLFLWRRLQDAYKKIDYAPKVVSCYLRSIEAIVKELQSPAYSEEHGEHRQTTLLRWLKSLDVMLSKTVATVLQEADKAYECFDMEHVKSSMSAVVSLVKLLYSFILYEDAVHVGQVSQLSLRGTLGKSLEGFREKLREMLVRSWVLLYTLLKEGISQNQEIFEDPLEDRIYYLRSVHSALGIRKLCNRSQKQFLRLMKSELLALDVKQDTEADICQIVFDVHGVKLSLNDNQLCDHGCSSEKLDRSTAVMMIDFVMKQAKKINIKDLPKSELKTTIDKVQQAIGMTKASSPLVYNRRILNTYLKTPIDPSELVRAIRGVSDLPLIPVQTQNAAAARNGWYFLLGHIALTRFRSQKRLSSGPTTDLDEAITWFRHDLEHGTSRWETWYRLAQTWDSKVEDDITWHAEKINNNRTELVTWQRNAIHCYSMAIATAAKTAEPEPETRTLLADLYTDFGVRLYSSSREPLSMGVFSLRDFKRHFSNEESQQMYQGQPFKEMKVYFAWRLASYLLRRAVVDKPKSWMTHYMLSKCLWKMFSCDESVRGSAKRVSLDGVLDSLLDTIDALPQRRDSRSDPIFEPHYKLISIVNKLVKREVLTPAEASKTLLATPRARIVNGPVDIGDWKRYILEVLRSLKSTDKANWHHRMALRAAHIIYDDDKGAIAAAAAKHELTQQIFTKTMTIQVWRPEFERPGRHFVYTTRYVLELLLRKVRKKQGDFINHTKLWEDMCLTYARVIRRAGQINEGHEESVFKPIGWEEFVANTARLEDLSQLSPESPALLELLRDAIELKKLNNNLMKVALLEDLIADVYSRIYQVNMPHVLQQVNEESKEKMKVDHILMTHDGPGDVSTPPNSAPASEAPAPRGRTKGIARRDIQKRAETIVQRKVAPRVPAKGLAQLEAGSTNAMVPNGPRPVVEIMSRQQAAGEAVSGQQSDIPNSLHDSADDESELSELDEERLSKIADKMQAPSKFLNQEFDPSSAHPSPTGDCANEEREEMDEEGDGEVEGEGDQDPELGEGEGEGEGETINEYEPGEGDGEGDDIEVEAEGGDEGDDQEAGGEEVEEGEEDGDTIMEGTEGGEGPEREPEGAPEHENENAYDSEIAAEL